MTLGRERNHRDALQAPEFARRLADHMHGHTRLDDGELLDKADEADLGAVRLVPRRPAARARELNAEGSQTLSTATCSFTRR